MTATTEPAHVMRALRYGLGFIGILLIAVNLRVGFVTVGPLLEVIRADLGLSSTLAGLLTGLPLISFALFSPIAPAVAARVGLDRTVWFSLAALMLGVLIRSIPIPGALWAGTAAVGAAIAFLNVLLPSLVKRNYPSRVSQLTGVYFAVQGAVAAAGAALVVPLAQGTTLGWRLALGIWAGVAVVAMVAYFPQIRGAAGTARSTGTPALTYRSPWKSMLGWQVTVFMGLQSMPFFVLMSWLPSIEQSHGVSAVTAGWHVSLFLVIGTVASLGAGVVLHRSSDERFVSVLMSIMLVLAFVGLAIAPHLTLLWIVMGAAGCGSLIVVALSLFSLRTSHHQQAAALSGMAQSIGYALAAVGPIVFGALYDVSGSWLLPLWLMAGLMTLMCFVAAQAGRARVIG